MQLCLFAKLCSDITFAPFGGTLGDDYFLGEGGFPGRSKFNSKIQQFMAYHNYRKDLKQKSRDLRNKSTVPEIVLWKRLRAKQLGVGFNRQKPIGNYIVDFLCKKARLIIEVDGPSHIGKEDYDMKRDEYLESLGYVVFRISNDDVMKHTDAVVKEISRLIEERL